MALATSGPSQGLGLPPYPAVLAVRGLVLPLLVPGFLPLPFLVPQGIAVDIQTGARGPQGPWEALVAWLEVNPGPGALVGPSQLSPLAPFVRWHLHGLVPDNAEAVPGEGPGEGALHCLALVGAHILPRQLTDQQPLLQHQEAAVVPDLGQGQSTWVSPGGSSHPCASPLPPCPPYLAQARLLTVPHQPPHSCLWGACQALEEG